MLTVLAFLLMASTGGEDAAPARLRSANSQLVGCKVVRQGQEASHSTRRCKGLGGYVLLVHDDDDRMSIDVVTPGGKVHPLDLWKVVSTDFSELGKRAEWKLRGSLPIALVVQYVVNELAEGREKRTDTPNIVTIWTVAKVTPTEICVTDKFRGSTARAEASRAAATADSRPCLPGRGSESR
jgi:hypothetical protein